jgi:hypothetical protein
MPEWGRMFTRLKFILALTLTLALAAATASTAQGAKGMEIAVQDDAVLTRGLYGNAEQALALAQDLHVTYIRVNVDWSNTVGRAKRKRKAPKRIKYNFSGIDNMIRAAAARGQQAQLALSGPAPAWATSNHKLGVRKPKAKAFKVFARATAKHFKGRVHRYTIWNEPNHRGWIAPIKSQGKVYRALYLAGYSAIKRVDRSAKVFIGETSPFGLAHGRNAQPPLKFLRSVTCANKRYKRAKRCGTIKTDGYAHHPYDFDHKPTYKFRGKDNVTIGVLSRLTRALSKLRKAKLLTTPSGGVPYVYLTEYGFFSSGRRKMSPSRHAKYLVQGFQIAQRNPRVKQMLQYLLLQPPRGRFSHFDTSIANRRGVPRTPFKKLKAWTDKAAAAGRIAVPSP